MKDFHTSIGVEQKKAEFFEKLVKLHEVGLTIQLNIPLEGHLSVNKFKKKIQISMLTSKFLWLPYTNKFDFSRKKQNKKNELKKKKKKEEDEIWK